MNKLEQIRAIQKATELNYNITIFLIALTMLVLFIRVYIYTQKVLGGQKKFDDSTEYRVRYESEEWRLQYKTSTSAVWRSFQNYCHMAEAMQDKEYFEALNKKQ